MCETSQAKYMHVAMQAVTAAGVTKDAKWIADLHEGAAKVLSNGDLTRCHGVNMDGTAANRRAGADLEGRYPHMVNLICQSHSLDLINKDLGNASNKQQKKTTCGEVLQKAKALVNAIGDSEKVRAHVQRIQKDKYGKVSTVHVIGALLPVTQPVTTAVSRYVMRKSSCFQRVNCCWRCM
jgi:hypothetical protein